MYCWPGFQVRVGLSLEGVVCPGASIYGKSPGLGLLSALKVQEEVVGLRLNSGQFRNSLSGGRADVEGYAL